MSIYKDCDIRGIYQEEFNEKDACLIGRSVGSLKQNATLAVGGDVRISTPILKENLIKGLIQSGVHVVDLGVVTTPMFYYGLKSMDLTGGIMVTASHNPARYNGFKLMFGELPITAEEIREIEEVIEGKHFTDGTGSYEKRDLFEAYAAYISGFFPASEGLADGRKIVLDCCDGATSEIVPEIMERCGFQVIRLYCGSDGNFPNRDPNPANYDCLKDLERKVRKEHAALGAAYDGDGDRVVFVDDRGRYIASEYSCALFTKDCLKQRKGAVVYDQKSASVLKKTILQYGGEPVMERSGYGFIKSRFLKCHALMAGEISGHFFFSELGNDDGLYATLKMCNILSGLDMPLSEAVDQLPKSLITPDLRMFCPYQQQDEWLNKVRRLNQKYPVSELDGVRIDFGRGWFLIRKSVTEEAVTMRLEAESQEDMEKIKKVVTETLPELQRHPFF